MRSQSEHRSLRRWTLLGLAILWTGGLACHAHADNEAPASAARSRSGIWISREEILTLPMTGPAWEALVAEAEAPLRNPNLANQNDPNNVRVLAKALVFARTGDERFAREVRQACRLIPGTERSANTLALGRELMAYILAADLVQLDDAEEGRFKEWLRRVADSNYRGRSIRSTHEDRPNNWGTHAGATRLAMAVYLGDQREIERAAQVFRGWTGEPGGWQGFKFGEPWWQVKDADNQAVNPLGARRLGHSIDGVLPDDQRRAGRFRWPPPKENYVYEALQGAVAQAVLLERLGYPAWEWGDRALLRAFSWLHTQADYPAEGDDTWIPHLINRAYGADFPAPIPSKPGKGMGFSDWTHAPPPAADTSDAR